MRFDASCFLGVVCVSGCHSQAIDDRANEEIAAARANAERAAVYPSCPDRSTITGNCGLVLRRASTEDFRVRFREKKCGGKSDPECETIFQRMIDAWLRQRYPNAEWGAIALTCDSSPGRCDDPVQYELLLLDSHNLRVRDSFARAENELEAERRAAQERHAAQTSAAVVEVIGEVTYATHRGPKCRSYPSVGAGVTNTVCSR